MKIWTDGIAVTLLLICAAPAVAADRAAAVACQEVGFYGIPFALMYEDIGTLGLPYTLGSESAEGAQLRTATFSVSSSVSITVVFDARGRLAELRTSSRAATGPRGIRVGSTQSQVQAAWPEGKLYYGNGETGPYAIYFTGTNIGFRMSEDDADGGIEERTVKEIIAKPYQLKL